MLAMKNLTSLVASGIVPIFLFAASFEAIGKTKEPGVAFPMKYEGGSLDMTQHGKLTSIVGDKSVIFIQGKKRFEVPYSTVTEVSYGADVHLSRGRSNWCWRPYARPRRDALAREDEKALRWNDVARQRQRWTARSEGRRCLQSRQGRLPRISSSAGRQDWAEGGQYRFGPRHRRHVETLESQPLANDGDEYVNRDCNPDLSLHSVLAGAKESLDSQVLLDPLEKQLHLPPRLVDGGDSKGRKCEVVSEKDKSLVGFQIKIGDSP
jgi:hypothetical protein